MTSRPARWSGADAGAVHDAGQRGSARLVSGQLPSRSWAPAWEPTNASRAECRVLSRSSPPRRTIYGVSYWCLVSGASAGGPVSPALATPDVGCFCESGVKRTERQDRTAEDTKRGVPPWAQARWNHFNGELDPLIWIADYAGRVWHLARGDGVPAHASGRFLFARSTSCSFKR